MEEYLYCIPYVGDDWVLLPEKQDPKKVKSEHPYEYSIANQLIDLEGKRIKITIEVVE